MSHRLFALFVTASAGLAFGCATAGEEAPASDAGADNDAPDTPADAQPTPDTQPPLDAEPDAPAAVAITLSHSTSANIASGNSVACASNTTNRHRDNSYYRTFNLSALGVTSDLDVSQVQVGVESATGNGGLQPATLNLYTLNGAFTVANLSLIGTVGVTVADQTLSLLDIPITTTVPAGSTLVVELFTPDGDTAGHAFFLGSNSLGESAPGFLRAPDCGINEPTDMATVGFPDMHIVMSVTGTHRP